MDVTRGVAMLSLPASTSGKAKSFEKAGCSLQRRPIAPFAHFHTTPPHRWLSKEDQVPPHPRSPGGGTCSSSLSKESLPEKNWLME